MRHLSDPFLFFLYDHFFLDTQAHDLITLHPTAKKTQSLGRQNPHTVLGGSLGPTSWAPAVPGLGKYFSSNFTSCYLRGML